MDGRYQPHLHGESETMGVRKILLIVASCLALSAAAQAVAAEPIVRNQLFGLGGRFEASLTPAFSVFDKYTRHMTISAGLGYFLNDYIGFEFEGGYAVLHGDRSLLKEIVSTAVDTLQGIKKLPLSDLKYMTWFVQGGLVLCPLYGKLELSSELAVSFHLYFVGGAGVADWRYHQLGDALPDGTDFERIEVDYGVKPTFYFGGGLRFHFARAWSLRLEIRDEFFYDKYEAEHKVATTVEPKTITDFNHVTLVRLSMGWSF